MWDTVRWLALFKRQCCWSFYIARRPLQHTSYACNIWYHRYSPVHTWNPGDIIFIRKTEYATPQQSLVAVHLFSNVMFMGFVSYVSRALYWSIIIGSVAAGSIGPCKSCTVCEAGVISTGNGPLPGTEAWFQHYRRTTELAGPVVTSNSARYTSLLRDFLCHPNR